MPGSATFTSNQTIYTTSSKSCQSVCCKGWSVGWHCEGTDVTTPDERDAFGICSAIPEGVDTDNDGISDRDECERRMLWLMRIVSTTRISDGKTEKLCFGYMEGVRDKCGCKKGDTEFGLAPGCTITFYRAKPNPIGSIPERGEPISWDRDGRPIRFGPTRYYRPTGFRVGFRDHSLAEVCCGKGAIKKCMYFDVGSQNRAGNLGGADNWFPPDHPGLNDVLDPTEIEPDDFIPR